MRAYATAEHDLDQFADPVIESLMETERCVLSSLYIRNSIYHQRGVIGSVSQILPGETMFYAPHHRVIYAAMMRLFRKSWPVDLITLRDELLRVGKLEEIGGEEYLIELSEHIPSAANGPYYAQIVRDAWTKRIITSRCQKLAKKADSMTADEIFAEALELTRGNLIRNQFAFTMSDERASSEPKILEGLATGISSIDAFTSMGGLPKRQLSVVGAHTGWGKSTICQQIVRNVAERGERVAYCCFGADLDRDSLEARWCKQATGHMPTKNLQPDFWNDVEAEISAIRQLPIIVYEAELAPDRSIETCIEWLEGENRANPFSLVVLDYAQVMRTKRKTFGYKEIMEAVAQECNSAAKRLGCGVLLASQVQAEDSLEFRYSQEFKHAAGFAFVLQRVGPETLGGYYDVRTTVVKNRWGYDGEIEPRGKWVSRFTRFEF